MTKCRLIAFLAFMVVVFVSPITGFASLAVASNAAKELDYGPYMADLQRRIKRSWFPAAGFGQKKAVVVFKIHSDGSLSHLRLQSSSGLAIVDNSAVNAVQNASPFRPLPLGSPASVDIQFTFDQNVDIDQDTTPAYFRTIPAVSDFVAESPDAQIDELVLQVNAYISQVHKILWNEKKSKQERIVEVQDKYKLAKPLLEMLLISADEIGSSLQDKEVVMADLGKIEWVNGQYAVALPLLDQALKLKEKKYGTAATKFDRRFLAALYVDQGDLARAEQLYKNAVATNDYLERTRNDPFLRQVNQHVNDKGSLASSLGDLAGFYYATKNYSQAEHCFLQKLGIEEKNLGLLNNQTVQTREDLFIVLLHQSKGSEQEELYKNVVAKFQGVKGQESELAMSLGYLAWCYCYLGKYAEAEVALEKALSLRIQLDAEPRIVAANIQNLAVVSDKLGMLLQAEDLYKRLLEFCKTTAQMNRYDELIATQELACFYWRHDNYDKARPLIEREQFLVAQVPRDSWRDPFIAAKPWGKPYPTTLAEHWAWFYYSCKQYEKAELLFKESNSVAGLRAVYKAQNKQQKSEKLDAQHEPLNYLGQPNLAKSLVEEGRYSEAEKVCLETLDYLKNSLEYSKLFRFDLEPIFARYWARPQLSGAGNSTIGPKARGSAGPQSQFWGLGIRRVFTGSEDVTEIRGVNTAGNIQKYQADYRRPTFWFEGNYITKDGRFRSEPGICYLPVPELQIAGVEPSISDPQSLLINGELLVVSNSDAQACLQLQLVNIYRKQGKIAQAEALSTEAVAAIGKLSAPKAEMIRSYFAGPEQP